jgi:hypothetical protein
MSIESKGDVCEDIKVIERASERLNREMQEGRASLLSCRKGLDEWRDKATRSEEEAKIIRADLEALQAAVCGLTGKEGDVASMVGDLADIARGMAALKAAVEARDVLDARLQASARVASALRAILRDRDESVLRCLDDLDKALRGMPLGETRGRQGERFHRPAIDLRPEDLPGFVASLDQHVLGLEQRVIALEYGREYAATSEGKS